MPPPRAITSGKQTGKEAHLLIRKRFVNIEIWYSTIPLFDRSSIRETDELILVSIENWLNFVYSDGILTKTTLLS